MIKTFNQFNQFNLTEEKQVGILYHYTYIENLVSITDTGTLRPMEYEGISFTRNKHLHTHNDSSIGTEARFIIDGNKLSRNYKVRPFNYFAADTDTYNSFDMKYQHQPDTDEAEERVMVPISPISKYVIGLEIDDLSLHEVFEHETWTSPEEMKKRFPNIASFIKFLKMHYLTKVVNLK